MRLGLIFLVSTVLFSFTFKAIRDVPNTGDNSIILSTSQSDSLNFSNFSKYLLQKGYMIENRDVESLSFATVPKTSLNHKQKPSFVRHQLYIQVLDNKIIVIPRIEVAAPNFQIIWSDWIYKYRSSRMLQKNEFSHWHWFYNFKVLLENYPNQTSISYTRR